MATEWHVKTTGTSGGAGTDADPWDLNTGLNSLSVQPGDTVWIHGGEYTAGTTLYRCALEGSSGSPIIVRNHNGERVTLRHGLGIPSAPWGDPAYVWIWGLEIAPRSYDANSFDALAISGSDPNYYAPGIKVINCVLHDSTISGLATWQRADDQEAYGNLIYYNGYDVPGDSRGHGHGIYCQAIDGPKLIKDNIVFRNFDKGVQLYSQTEGCLNNVTFEGNTFFNNSEISYYGNDACDNMTLQGLVMNYNTTAVYNMTYAPTWATSIVNNIGDANNAEVSNNYFVSHAGSPTICWSVNDSTPGLVMNNNTFYGAIQGFTLNQYGSGNVQLSSEPNTPTIFVRGNSYEAGRANITIFNWPDSSSVSVNISSLGIPNGTTYIVKDAQNFYGSSVASGTYNGSNISIPMTGLTVAAPEGLDANHPTPSHTGPAFGAFVLIANVAGGNVAPTVSAGSDQIKNWPTNTASLDGTVSDDGLPNPPAACTYSWTKQSGAGTVTFASSTSVDTTATFSTVGTYVLRLTANDSQLTAYDEMSVSVRLNAAPSVGAGVDQVKTWPTNTATLDGTVTDDGLPNPPAACTYSWTKQSGAGTVTFASSTSVDTTATFSTTGTYVLRLTANDSALTAYDEMSVTVSPGSSVTELMKLLMDESSGTVAADATGNGHSATLVNGPTWVAGHAGNAVHFDESNDYATIADFSYGPEFSVSFWYKLDDNTGTSQMFFFAHNGVAASNSVNVYINQASNPTRPNQIETVIRDSTDGSGSAIYFSPTIDTNWHLYALTCDTGVGTKVYWDANQVGSDTEGGDAINPTGSLYMGERSAGGRYYGGSLDDVRLWNGTLAESGIDALFGGGGGGNQPPTVSAGVDQVKTWPTNTASLDGTVTDDGLPNPPGVTTVSWTKQSGTGTVTFASSTSVDTTATFSTSGTYVLRLTANDSALTAYDEMSVSVRLNSAPTVSAGVDQVKTWPTNTASLDGTVTDDGLPNPPAACTYSWTKQSGAGTVTFASSTSVDTTATFSTVGTYVLRLTANDSALTAYDEMNVSVNTQSNVAPTVSAGVDQSKTWPTNTASLDGTVTDDGLPNPPAACTYSWTKQSGAGTVTFASSTSVDTTATFSTVGTYVLRLTANDSALTAYDEMVVTVNPSGGLTLILDLPMDENTGTIAYDASGNGRNGTLINGPTWVSGQYSYAVHFDETNDYVSIADFTYGPEFTLAFWFKLDDNTGTVTQFLWGHGSVAGANTLNIWVNEASNPTNPNTVQTCLRDSDDGSATTMLFSVPTDGLWHLFALTCKDGEGSKVYLDGGTPDASDASRGGDSLNPTGAIRLASRTDGSSSRYLGGSLDDVQIYTTALTQAQIEDLMP